MYKYSVFMRFSTGFTRFPVVRLRPTQPSLHITY